MSRAESEYRARQQAEYQDDAKQFKRMRQEWIRNGTWKRVGKMKHGEDHTKNSTMADTTRFI